MLQYLTLDVFGQAGDARIKAINREPGADFHKSEAVVIIKNPIAPHALLLTSAAASGSAPPAGSLPLYAQIAGEPGSTLPQLHLDLHVYSPLPGKRFVMINMQKLHQGDALADGVSVVTIRPDGVVLSYQGREFLLPR